MGQFPARNRGVNVRAVLDLDSRCGPNQDKVAGHIHRVPVEAKAKVVLEVPVDQAPRAVLGVKDLEPYHLVRVLVRALLGVQECFRRFPIKCRRKQNPANRCIRAAQHSVSGRWSISARWKASGSCIPRGSVPVQVAEERQRWRLLHQNRVRRAK